MTEDRKVIDATPRAIALAEIFAGMTSEQLAACEERLDAIEQQGAAGGTV